MELAHRWGDRNLTKLELITAVIIISVLIGTFSKYVLGVFSKAEETMLNTTVLNINAYMNYRAALLILSNKNEELEPLTKINPFEHMGTGISMSEFDTQLEDKYADINTTVSAKPVNYKGVITTDYIEYMEKSHWYYNPEEKYIVYVPRNTEFFYSDVSGLPRVRFRMILDYKDNNANYQYEPDIDQFKMIKLEAVDNYQWSY